MANGMLGVPWGWSMLHGACGSELGQVDRAGSITVEHHHFLVEPGKPIIVLWIQI